MLSTDRIEIHQSQLASRDVSINQSINFNLNSHKHQFYSVAKRKIEYTYEYLQIKEGLKVTLVAVIVGFRSDLSITRKTDGNFGNASAGVLFSKVTY